MGCKADIPRGFVELFKHPIEGRAHALCHVVSVLRQAYLRRVDCLASRIGGIRFGQVGMFVLCGGDAVIKEKVVTYAQPPKHPSDVLLPCYFALLAVFFWVEHDGSVVCFL